MNIWIRLSEICKDVVDITLDQIREGLKEPTSEMQLTPQNTQEPLEVMSVTEVLCTLLDDTMDPDIELTQVETTELSETPTTPMLDTEQASQQKHTTRSAKSQDATDARWDRENNKRKKAKAKTRQKHQGRKVKLELMGVSIDGKYESI